MRTNKQITGALVLSVILLVTLGFAMVNNNTSRVDDLLERMTLNEKIGQLNQYSIGAALTGPGEKSAYEKQRLNQLINGQVGSVLNLLGAEEAYQIQKRVVEESRLGIPLIFAFDVVHGYKTIFPIPLAESASWDIKAVENSAQVAAREAAAAGLQWTFAPMVDVSRDARWGRVMEGAGEDPFLGSLIAKARIQGFQGNDLSHNYTIAACAKHFAGYGFVESGKDYNNVYLGTNQLFNTILPPFEAAAEADVATFMNAFNDIDGVPSTANSFLLRDVLRDRWDYRGVVVSDWNSIGELISHGVAEDNKQAAALAMGAGADVDMEGSAYVSHLEELVSEGHIGESLIDQAVRRVLQLKEDLGLLDDPYKYFDKERQDKTLLSEAHMELARDVARKSIVLLKNDNDLLPLDTKNIALIGPLAKDKDSPLGNWRGAAEPNSAVSLYEGLKAALPQVNINYAEGCKLSIGPNNFFDEVQVETTDRTGFEKAVSMAEKAEVVIMALGETAYMSGEGRSRADIGLPGLQLELLKAVYAANKNIILVLMNGRPLTIPWEAEHIPAIVEAWHLGSMAGHAIADVLTGKYNPSGKLPMTFPRTVGQVPVYYNHKMTGRPASAPGQVFYTHHTDVPNTPLYPFGYGLSYAQFRYSPITLSTTKLASEKTLSATVHVTNTSHVDGHEVVQLYIRDRVASITRPVKELRGFKKVWVKAGATTEVTFELSDKDLGFYGPGGKYKVEPGQFDLMIGSSSAELQSSSFNLIEE